MRDAEDEDIDADDVDLEVEVALPDLHAAIAVMAGRPLRTGLLFFFPPLRGVP